MTLGTTHSLVSYDGTGSIRRFDVTFEFHAASDLEVILVTAATGAERVQTQGFHYHVVGNRIRVWIELYGRLGNPATGFCGRPWQWREQRRIWRCVHQRRPQHVVGDSM